MIENLKELGFNKHGFKRYTSIENSYNQKQITRAFYTFPELETESFIVMEKIDGCNIQIIFFPDGTYSVGKRTGIVENDVSFNDIHNTVKKYPEFINTFTNYAKQTGFIYTLYGELYGSGIQKRIDYGPEKYIAIFDVMVNCQMEPFSKYINILEKLNVCVPIIYRDIGFYDAVNIDVESDEYDNKEGIVVKPLCKEYFNSAGKRFILKKKNSRFSEKNKVKKTIIPLSELYNYEILELKEIFISYLNKNRMLSIFSKHGEIEDSKQIGEYIKLIHADMMEDFKKDTVIPEMNKNESKYVYDISRQIVPILKKFL